MRQNLLESLLKYTFFGCTSGVSDSVGLKIVSLNKFPADADSAGWWSSFEKLFQVES